MARDEACVGSVGVLVVGRGGDAGPGEVLVKMPRRAPRPSSPGPRAAAQGGDRPCYRVPRRADGRRHRMEGRTRGRVRRVRGYLLPRGETMFGYRVPAPDEAMLISGRKSAAGRHAVPGGHRATARSSCRCSARARFLTLSMCEAEVAEVCVTKQGISLNVRAVIAFKVGNDAESIVNAAQRFLSDQDQMSVLTGRIFAGHLRSIVGSMTVEEIVTERQKLATEVLEGSKEEMARIGPARRLPADPVDRRHGDRLHRGHVGPAQRRDPAAGADRAGTGRPGLGRGRSSSRSASRPSMPGKRRSFRRSTRPKSTRRRPRRHRPDRSPRRRRSRRSSPRRPSWPSAKPNCASSNWSPRSSGRPRPRPSGP